MLLDLNNPQKQRGKNHWHKAQTKKNKKTFFSLEFDHLFGIFHPWKCFSTKCDGEKKSLLIFLKA
jgi:hypothetical protein